jgi:hypothetical protein
MTHVHIHFSDVGTSAGAKKGAQTKKAQGHALTEEEKKQRAKRMQELKKKQAQKAPTQGRKGEEEKKTPPRTKSPAASEEEKKKRRMRKLLRRRGNLVGGAVKGIVRGASKPTKQEAKEAFYNNVLEKPTNAKSSGRSLRGRHP